MIRCIPLIISSMGVYGLRGGFFDGIIGRNTLYEPLPDVETVNEIMGLPLQNQPYKESLLKTFNYIRSICSYGHLVCDKYPGTDKLGVVMEDFGFVIHASVKFLPGIKVMKGCKATYKDPESILPDLDCSEAEEVPQPNHSDFSFRVSMRVQFFSNGEQHLEQLAETFRRSVRRHRFFQKGSISTVPPTIDFVRNDGVRFEFEKNTQTVEYKHNPISANDVCVSYSASMTNVSNRAWRGLFSDYRRFLKTRNPDDWKKVKEIPSRTKDELFIRIGWALLSMESMTKGFLQYLKTGVRHCQIYPNTIFFDYLVVPNTRDVLHIMKEGTASPLKYFFDDAFVTKSSLEIVKRTPMVDVPFVDSFSGIYFSRFEAAGDFSDPAFKEKVHPCRFERDLHTSDVFGLNIVIQQMMSIDFDIEKESESSKSSLSRDYPDTAKDIKADQYANAIMDELNDSFKEIIDFLFTLKEKFKDDTKTFNRCIRTEQTLQELIAQKIDLRKLRVEGHPKLIGSCTMKDEEIAASEVLNAIQNLIKMTNEKLPKGFSVFEGSKIPIRKKSQASV
eukprot:GHVP01023499.1.p1 GENE.GHVP01023499.1~~GHVP01023499.1.p1  ORF type:complete len:560 (+),score=91.64 GHVP01023499.1:283-1962(+)